MTKRSGMKRRGFLFHVLPALVYVLGIFWLGVSHLTIEIPHGFLPQDKLGHFIAFGLLVVLLLRALRFGFPATNLRQLLILSVVGSSALGALLECWQSLFPYRSVELADWTADTLGALLAGLLVKFWLHWRRPRTNTMDLTNPAG